MAGSAKATFLPNAILFAQPNKPLLPSSTEYLRSGSQGFGLVLMVVDWFTKSLVLLNLNWTYVEPVRTGPLMD